MPGMKHRLSRGLCAAALAAALALPTAAQVRDGDSVVIEWPNRDFPTLQRAIDALPDGGELRIAAGEFLLSEPLFVRGKRLLIEGEGCDELARGESGNERATHLAGPGIERVVAADEAVGLFNYEEAGGTLRNLKLSGFDAGVRGFAAEGQETPGPQLNLEEVCISDTGRGIAWSAPSSLFAENVLIRDVLWNGISVFPAPLFAGGSQWINFDGLQVFNAAQACVAVKNAFMGIGPGTFSNCGIGGGVLAANSLLQIQSTTIDFSAGPGIAVTGGATLADQVVVFQAVGFGVLFHKPFAAQISHSSVNETQPRSDGFWGDGVTVFGRGSANVTETFSTFNYRAGLSNFGSLVPVKDSTFQCNGFDLNAENDPGTGTPPTFQNLGGNKCGCPTPAGGTCAAQSTHLTLPEPLVDPLP